MAATEVRSPQRAPQRRMIYTGTNRFDFDRSRMPAHMEYVWRRVSVAEKPDTENAIMAEMNGWTPVPANRHPELAGHNATATQQIVRGGLMLMEQPKEYAQESREMDKFEAHNNLSEQIQRLGLEARRNGARGVKRTMEPVAAEIVE